MLAATDSVMSAYSIAQTAIDIAIERPMLRVGSAMSSPWLVIVVNPLNASTHSVVAASRPSTSIGPDDAGTAIPSPTVAAPIKPAIARIAIPAILIVAVTSAERSTSRLPTRLAIAAAEIATTPSTGTSTTESCNPNGRSRYVPKVRARRLSATTIETYMNSENEPAMTPGPYASFSSMAMPPEDGFTAEYRMYA